jgi:hypothetical protein
MAKKEGDVSVGLRRKAALTCGPAVSARDREERGNATLTGMLGLWLADAAQDGAGKGGVGRAMK